MTVLLPLFLIGFLTGCSETKAVQSDALYEIRSWPVTPPKPRLQSDVAELFVKGKAAYLSCVATVDLIKPAKTND